MLDTILPKTCNSIKLNSYQKLYYIDVEKTAGEEEVNVKTYQAAICRLQKQLLRQNQEVWLRQTTFQAKLSPTSSFSS